ncbi:MAG: CAP domain-containing protein [Kineosporiaceae bacterium]
MAFPGANRPGVLIAVVAAAAGLAGGSVLATVGFLPGSPTLQTAQSAGQVAPAPGAEAAAAPTVSPTTVVPAKAKPASRPATSKAPARTTTTTSAKPAPKPTKKPTLEPTKRPTKKPAATTPAAPASSDAREVLRLTNVERAKAGCPALAWNSRLATAAQRHSADMAANNYFEHNSQDGRSPFQRMKDAGYGYSQAAENIAAGQRSPASVMDSWMNSAGHRANILNCGLRELGVGVAKGGSYGIYWTQDFGTP